MKASVSYNDFKGTVAADIADHLSKYHGDSLKSIGHHFGLDQERFELIGLSFHGPDKFSVSLLCVDREQEGKIVSMWYDGDEKPVDLDQIFKRLNFVLHERFDDKYPDLNYDNEVRFSDFHKVEEQQ